MEVAADTTAEGDVATDKSHRDEGAEINAPDNAMAWDGGCT